MKKNNIPVLMLISSLIILTMLISCTMSPAPAAPASPSEQPREVPVTKEGAAETTAEGAKDAKETADQAPAASPTEHPVEMTFAGFVPEIITIQAGDTVTWMNKDSKTRWPASAIHPTHEAYPGSSINKCNTPNEQGAFDACGYLSSGKSYSFTFTEKGSWNYHDHLHPSMKGKVVVE